MEKDIGKRIRTISGCDGSRIGIGIGGPVARVDVGRKGGRLRFSGKNVGIGVQTPCYELEVRSDGAVGVGQKVK